MLKTDDVIVLVIDFQTRLMPSMYGCDELERRVETFLIGSGLLGLPTLVTQQYTKGLGDTIASIKGTLGDFVPIEKTTFSCYGCQEFVEKLTATGKKKVIITGIEAHICVQQTVLNLLENGYEVYVMADCIGSRNETDRIYAERRMQQAGAILTTTESMLFGLMGSADHPKRKEISNLIK